MIDAKFRAKYDVDIGIEAHVQLVTKSKLFCGCDNDARGAKPNTHVCPVCLGLPGSLPVLNERAVELAIRAGVALNAQIAEFTKFDRKNYFYPDLPKGYQISQYDQPIVASGKVKVPLDDKELAVYIERAHLEEDAAKTVSPAGSDYSLVDFNRAGTPLLEIVSAPDMHTPAQARAYATELYHIMRYAGVSDVNLASGNMRFDVNISARLKGARQLGTRAEIKNINSFRFVEKVCDYEINRQVALLEKGELVTQETRGWDEAKGKTFAQRTKEEAHDYRYFPEPDLPPLVIGEQLVKAASQDLRLPADIRRQLVGAGIKPQQAQTLLDHPLLLDAALQVAEAKPAVLKRVANWLTVQVRHLVAETQPEQDIKLSSVRLIKLAEMVEAGTLSSTGADEVLAVLLVEDRDPEAIAKDKQLLQVSDEREVQAIVDQVIGEHAQAAEDYRAGNVNSLQFLVGQVMRASRGAANPTIAADLLKKKLRAN